MPPIDDPASTQSVVTQDAILAVLEAKGFRRTRPREAVARQLGKYAALGRDFATEELWRQLQRENPRLGRATLFRSIDTLAELGVIDRIELADGTPRYRVCGRDHHHHLICSSCRRIEEINVCLPETDLSAAAAASGFTVERHSLELYGLCKNCRQREFPDTQG